MYRKLTAFLYIMIVFVILIFSSSFSEIAFQMNVSMLGAQIIYNILNIVCVYTAVFLVAKYVMREKLDMMYLGRPKPQKLWCMIAVLIPSLIMGFYLLFTKGNLANGNLEKDAVIYIIVSDVLGLGIRAALVEEILFRGVAFHVLQKSFGSRWALLGTGIIYTVPQLLFIHTAKWTGKILLFIADYIAGTALLLVTYESGSIWSAVVIHAIYNIFSGDSQIFHIDTEQNFPFIFSYTLESDSVLIGGLAGVDAMQTALPAIVGFLVIGGVALIRIKRNLHKA